MSGRKDEKKKIASMGLGGRDAVGRVRVKFGQGQNLKARGEIASEN